ncbi:preprotein translocase subunit YajC [bacterium]|nr:preprotein translocase subunit YajC [bacterium]|tara:strand:+ start:177 stop:449 length:273 start_codon:yes stop_codon:yes gene_type:complete
MDYIFPVAIILVFYFLIIRPPMTRAKKEKKFASLLKRGDRIITKSGMYGKVFEINDKDESCIIETQAGKIKFDRQAISMDLTEKLKKPKA